MSVEPSEDTTPKPKGPGKHRGLLADRFRPGPLVDHDAMRTSHEAIDEADGSRVIVHFLRERFCVDRAMRHDTVARLLERVGRGNRFVSPLVEAGIEAERVFVVEAKPSGVSLRSVLRARARARKPLEPRELLPVVARIGAALDALPASFVLGNISPRTVYVDEEGLRLTECFIVPALDRNALVELYREDESLRRAHAPESIGGRLDRAMDVFAVGALVHESLSFTPIGSDTTSSLGPLERDVRALLAETPSARLRLATLVERLASIAGLRVPELDAQPFELDPATRAARLAAFDDASAIDDVEDAITDDDDDDDVISAIREDDKTRQIALANLGPVIDDLGLRVGPGQARLPAPAIHIEAPAQAAPRAPAPKAPPPARPSKSASRSGSSAPLPAPKSIPPAPSAAPAAPPEAPTKPPLLDTTPSVEISMTPQPPRPDTTDRIRDARKRPGDTTLQLRAIEDPSARPTMMVGRMARTADRRLVLVAILISGALLTLAIGYALMQKRAEEAERRELIERRLQEIRQE